MIKPLAKHLKWRVWEGRLAKKLESWDGVEGTRFLPKMLDQPNVVDSPAPMGSLYVKLHLYVHVGGNSIVG